MLFYELGNKNYLLFYLSIYRLINYVFYLFIYFLLNYNQQTIIIINNMKNQLIYLIFHITHYFFLHITHNLKKKFKCPIFAAAFLGMAVCAIRKKDNKKKILQMFPDDDIRETIINYADGAGEENTVINWVLFSNLSLSPILVLKDTNINNTPFQLD